MFVCLFVLKAMINYCLRQNASINKCLLLSCCVSQYMIVIVIIIVVAVAVVIIIVVAVVYCCCYCCCCLFCYYRFQSAIPIDPDSTNANTTIFDSSENTTAIKMESDKPDKTTKNDSNDNNTERTKLVKASIPSVHRDAHINEKSSSKKENDHDSSKELPQQEQLKETKCVSFEIPITPTTNTETLGTPVILPTLTVTGLSPTATVATDTNTETKTTNDSIPKEATDGDNEKKVTKEGVVSEQEVENKSLSLQESSTNASVVTVKEQSVTTDGATEKGIAAKPIDSLENMFMDFFVTDSNAAVIIPSTVDDGIATIEL